MVIVLYRAEIESTSDSIGYMLRVPKTEDTVTTKYTHHSRVDGEDTYGYSQYCFLRRGWVAGCHRPAYINGAGSRCVGTRLNTGYPGVDISNNIIGRDC